MVPIEERVEGCILGGALGDSCGGPLEGASDATPFEIVGRLRLSDDTQLTLATCESIMDFGGVDPANLATRLAQWFQAGKVRGVGSSTLKAMRDLSAGVHWALAGAKGEYAAGNGAAMRVAPLAFVLDPYSSQDRTKIRDVCRITHHNDEAYVGSLAVILAIRSVLSGDWSNQNSFLALAAKSLPDSSVRDRMIAFQDLQLPAREVASMFGASGYVVDTVPLALYCAQHIAVAPLEEVVHQAASVRGDSDTIASITGQIAGVVVGSRGVPQSRIADVEDGAMASEIARKFAEYVRISVTSPV